MIVESNHLDIEEDIASREEDICGWEEKLAQIERELPQIVMYRLELQRDIAVSKLRVMELKGRLNGTT